MKRYVLKMGDGGGGGGGGAGSAELTLSRGIMRL